MDGVLAFLNTLDVEGGTDALATPQGVGAWIAENGLLPGPPAVSPEDHAAALALRDALRAYARANHDGRLDEVALAELNRLAAGFPVIAAFGGLGLSRLVPAEEGARAALAVVLAAVHEAVLDGSWARVKICASGTCQWAFLDRSKNRSGTWCSMATCGNRPKVRRYRERRRATQDSAP